MDKGLALDMEQQNRQDDIRYHQIHWRTEDLNQELNVAWVSMQLADTMAAEYPNIANLQRDTELQELIQEIDTAISGYEKSIETTQKHRLALEAKSAPGPENDAARRAYARAFKGQEDAGYTLSTAMRNLYSAVAARVAAEHERWRQAPVQAEEWRYQAERLRRYGQLAAAADLDLPGQSSNRPRGPFSDQSSRGHHRHHRSSGHHGSSHKGSGPKGSGHKKK